MRKLGLFLPLLVGFAAVPAQAQGLGVTGRAELRLGYDEPRGELTVQNRAFTNDFGVSGALIGVEAGVDARITEGILVGAYAGLEYSRADECVRRPFFDITSTRNDTVCLDAGRNITAGGRLGVPMGDGGLIYGKGGYSKGKFEGSYAFTSVASATPVVRFTDNDSVAGYHLGAGFELNFGRNFYGKGEYVHTRYENAFTDAARAAQGTAANPDEFDLIRHQLVLGFGMRFGG